VCAAEARLPAPRRILVINVSRIGDTLLVTPALRALAAHWPRAELVFLGHPKRVEIIRHLPFVAATHAITKSRARWRGWLGGKRFDLALVFGFDRALVAYALRVAQRVAAFRQRDARLDARLFRCVEPPAFQTLHAVHSPLLLTRALGIADASYRLAYSVTDEERAWAGATLQKTTRPLVGLQVASFPTKSYRDWPLQNFEALCERIVAHWPAAHLLLFGGSLDQSRNEKLAARFPGRATRLAGALSLRQSAALMNELDLYVGVDTGPTHIMGALDAPMVALYHCYSPSRLLGPLERPRCYVVDHPRATAGCTPETPMAEIPVEAVWSKVQEALSTR
jgi:heptosyltransferase III